MKDHIDYTTVRQRASKKICICTHLAPEEDDHFCTVEEQRELALDYQFLRRSNPGRIRWVEDELFLYHAGDLLDFDGEVINLVKVVGRDEDGDHILLIDQLLSKCPASAMKRLVARADGSHVNMLDDDPILRERHLIFLHAMQIHRCRTEGRCSHRKINAD